MNVCLACNEDQRYAPVNGPKMYYEIEGTGSPLAFIPPAIGFAGLHSFPTLTESQSVITMDLQGNGRTADIPKRPLSIEQYAQDVVDLLTHLGIANADFFGESYNSRNPLLPRRVKVTSHRGVPASLRTRSVVGVAVQGSLPEGSHRRARSGETAPPGHAVR